MVMKSDSMNVIEDATTEIIEKIHGMLLADQILKVSKVVVDVDR